MRRFTAAALCTLLLAGCAPTVDPEPPADTTPKVDTVTLVVLLEDKRPFHGSGFIDGQTCSANEGRERPDVTVTSADGTIVATSDVIHEGDNMDNLICRFTQRFPSIQRSGFYTITFTDSEGGEHSETVQMPAERRDLTVTVGY